MTLTLSHVFLFSQNTTCCRKPRVISGGRSALPSTPPLDLPLTETCPLMLCNAETQRAMSTRLDMSRKLCFNYFICTDIFAPRSFWFSGHKAEEGHIATSYVTGVRKQPTPHAKQFIAIVKQNWLNPKRFPRSIAT